MSALGGGSVGVVGLLLFAAAGSVCAQSPQISESGVSRLRIERLDAPDGAEVDTFIYALPNNGGDLPLVSILVDTLGDSDPTNDTLRNVWVLTYARPSLLQRIVAGLPFLYIRPGQPQPRDGAAPSPVLDMSAGGSGKTAFKLLRALAQSQFLDSAGLPIRASTRSYWVNSTDFRNQHVWSALPVLAAADESSTAGALSRDEMERVQARLLLSTHLFGDMVSDSYLGAAFDKERDTQLLYRQHNWEMLRQQAEDNGLYFEPLTLGFLKDANALLWARRDSCETRRQSGFNSQFLGIANPYEGSWLEKWKGYTEQWTLDENGARVPPGTQASHTVDMVPVALYSLDYPKAPLLLVDFRQPSKPKRGEALRRGFDQLTTGILGLTTYGNLEYFAAKTTWTFIRRRHGAAVDRSARLRAYAQLRHSLYMDGSLNPELRRDLLRRVDGYALNPFENGVQAEAQIARNQYAALRAYVTAPDGLARKVDRARSREIARRVHSGGTLALFRLASISTFGIYRHNERITPDLLAEIDRQRRFAWHKRFLQQVIDSTPPAEVAYNTAQVQRSLDAITEIGEQEPDLREASAALVRRVLAQTADESTRRRCFECLEKLALLRTGAPAEHGGE
jgi:hypothetical protein